jgi:glyoxylase-like metal-dependent hydrolase (beta-lactamase superfamily II)
MKRIALTLLLVFLAAQQAAHAITAEKTEFKKIAEDVYAFVGKLNDANAMAIVTKEGVVVVDTGNNPPETRIFQKFIQSVTAQPVRFIIITQNHGDHIGGTPLFSPPATVIVHDRVAKEWAGWRGYQVKSWQRRFPERVEAPWCEPARQCGELQRPHDALHRRQDDRAHLCERHL